MKRAKAKTDLPISGSVIFDSPTSFSTEGFKDLVIVTVFRQIEVTLSSKAGVNLSSDGSSPALSGPIILPLPPRRLTATIGGRSGAVGGHIPAREGGLGVKSRGKKKWRNFTFREWKREDK